MNRTLRAITAVLLIAIITFCAISLCQGVGSGFRLDVTEQKLYTLSDGTKSILGKLNQPVRLTLYYTKTATRKAPDQIRFYTNYYYFVESLLNEYERASNGMIKLEIIDPRPYSQEEEAAIRFGLKRFPITADENFFFGLVLQTEFGVVKNIPFFSPDRQNFVEYDISYLIDTAMTREKKRIGVLSSLPITGEDISGYMAMIMRQQGKAPKPAWTIITHLQQKYEITKIENDANEITDVDILLVVHPKNLEDETLFAIDQFVLKGGRAIICVDPRCFADDPRDPMGRQAGQPVSDLNSLLSGWGVEMLAGTFAGDKSLALYTQVDRNERAKQLIGYLNLTHEGGCFNDQSVITANLNQVRVFFSGVLRSVADANSQIQVIPLLQTTSKGNTWSVAGPWDWIRINPDTMMNYFIEGNSPVMMGCMVTGKFKSNFPDGIEITEANEPKQITGLSEGGDCAVAVFADVDFISDMAAYQNTVFGMKTPVGNNSDLMFNTIDRLGGSGDLIGVRTRGNFQRPFERVDEIRKRAESETAQKITLLNLKITQIDQELQKVVSSAKEGDERLIAAEIIKQQRQLEADKRQTQRMLRQVRMQERVEIEQMGSRLQNLNMWLAPAVILLISIVLSIRRSVLRRYYVSHASDS